MAYLLAQLVPINSQLHSVYLFGRREIVSTDLEFLRDVTVKKFAHFQNRLNVNFNPSSKLSNKSLFRNLMTALTGDDWKRVRNRVTPAFTTGKMKRLIPTLNDSSRLLCDVVDRYVAEQMDLPLKEVFGRFALDVIARAGFSQDLNTYSDLFDDGGAKKEPNPFIHHVKKIFSSSRNWRVMMFCKTVYSSLIP